MFKILHTRIALLYKNSTYKDLSYGIYCSNIHSLYNF